ncbi:MAG: hypothetical protein DMG46_08460 [Acidobacteria bacterium]|nr:MAG: hypothetical protein DMG46_08460 [Acidobacteriota bacterium]
MKLKIAFGTIMLVSILALSAMAQYSQPGYGQYPARVYGQGQGRLSPEDQRDFDKYYAKWVDDTRKNDQDDIGKDTRHMQEIMARNGIPPDVPFEQIASVGHSAGSYGGSRWQGRLTPEDQRDFDRYYAKWMEDTRKNDRDDISEDARHMQDIMTRYNIPADVPFDQVASMGYQGGYPGGAYPNGAYPRWQGRLSPEDQREFDKDYAKWVNDTRKNDRDDIDKDARKMQDIMARNSIPSNVPFSQIASNGYAAANGSPVGYPMNGGWAGRLSPADQKEFDKYYTKWVNDTRKNDRDDIDKDVRKMQEIMARNNIPSGVPYAQIASPGAPQY